MGLSTKTIYHESINKSFIKETYTKNYQPKLDKDKYAYHVDNTNRDIMWKLINDYLDSIEAIEIHRSLKVLKKRIDDIDTCIGSFFIYLNTYTIIFEGTNVTEFGMDTHAVSDNYTIIQLTEA